MPEAFQRYKRAPSTSKSKHWGKIGKIAEGNPVLSYAAIKSILIGMQQSKAGDLEHYAFGGGGQ